MCGLKKYDINILTQTKIRVGITTNNYQSIFSNFKVPNHKIFLKQQTIRHNQ